MAETLRRHDDDFDLPSGGVPNADAVAPSARFDSADQSPTTGANLRTEPRGEAILHGDEVDVANRPRHLLEPYSEAKERSWPLGALPGSVNQAVNRAGLRLRALSSGTFSRARLSDYAEEWKDRFADIVDGLQHSANRFARDFKSDSGEWKNRARTRVYVVRTRGQRLINTNPVQAVAVSAGIGLAVGVLLRLGRSRREY